MKKYKSWRKLSKNISSNTSMTKRLTINLKKRCTSWIHSICSLNQRPNQRKCWIKVLGRQIKLKSMKQELYHHWRQKFKVSNKWSNPRVISTTTLWTLNFKSTIKCKVSLSKSFKIVWKERINYSCNLMKC